MVACHATFWNFVFSSRGSGSEPLDWDHDYLLELRRCAAVQSICRPPSIVLDIGGGRMSRSPGIWSRKGEAIKKRNSRDEPPGNQPMETDAASVSFTCICGCSFSLENVGHDGGRENSETVNAHVVMERGIAWFMGGGAGGREKVKTWGNVAHWGCLESDGSR
jgi:hypothetical protein